MRLAVNLHQGPGNGQPWGQCPKIRLYGFLHAGAAKAQAKGSPKGTSKDIPGHVGDGTNGIEPARQPSNVHAAQIVRKTLELDSQSQANIAPAAEQSINFTLHSNITMDA